MIAVSWDPDLTTHLGSAAAETSPTAEEDDKQCPVLQHPWSLHRKQEREIQQQVSGQKSCFFGVETCPELIWDDWDVGREFTKTLVLRNTLGKQQRLHARPPASKFFTSSFPRTIVLRPGMSYSSLISFKPLQRREYEDTIEFQGKDGSFHVCIRATIHQTLEVPDFVQLPMCAVQHSSRSTFKLRNASILQVCFQWECADPFQLIPEQGRLRPAEECNVTVIFRPSGAQLYRRKASCRFGDEKKLELEKCCTVLLQGQAKYPCLQLRLPDSSEEKQHRCPALHFGSVALGCTAHKHFDIFNPSPVTASVSLSRLPGGVPLLDSEFRCNLTSGTVGPRELIQATVTYTPAVVDAVSVEYLSLECPGALNKSQLKLTGNCIGPTLSLSPSVVEFGCVKEGEAATQTVELVNSSPAEAVFQWDLDCSGHSVFRIQPAGGTVRPHSHVTLKAFYQPTHPIAHHRRVACLILHKDPLFLDLIGTCWTGLELTPGEQSGNQQENEIQMVQQGALCPQEESNLEPDSAAVIESTPVEEYFRSCLGTMDVLCSSASLPPRVTVEPTELLFNQKKSASSISSQAVSITNHTSSYLSMVWTAATDSPFSVSPSSCNLGPLKSTSFRVTYTPEQSNTLHGAQLECFAYSKEPPLCPPWCVTARVIGHSFQPGKEHFIPRCNVQHPKVVFPALNTPSYRTVLLRNCGDLPLTFQSPNPSSAASVFVLPKCGLVPPGDHQILMLRAAPTEDGPKQGLSLHLKLNASEHTQELLVVSTVEKPCVSVERDGTLYFQPTAVCSRTQRLHHIRNLSPFPIRFEWSILEQDQGLICVEPAAGELHPNESSIQTWSFSPQAEKMYRIKATLIYWPVKTPSFKSQLTLDVLGMGSKGSIEAEISVLDVGDIAIGTHRSIAVPLVNKSLCSVSVCLSAQQTLLDEDSIYDPQTEPCALQLKWEKGTIASHSRLLLQSTVRPHRRAQYQWTISYQTMNANGIVSSPPQALCEVFGKGVLPTLHVVDACSGGSVNGLSKIQLWNLFSLDGFNQHLLSYPAELSSRHSTGHSLNHSSMFTEDVMDFNFGASPLHSDPSIFVLMFRNPGSIPVEWTFLFPEDQMEEFEVLAERGVFDNATVCQRKNQEKQVYGISPRSGTLLPGQQRAVHFSYSHDFVGTDRLPVLLKLSHGREIWLNFQGLTVERDKPYLYFVSTQHVFTAVNIGNLFPPRQMYELYNAGAVPVYYEVDTAPLTQQQLDSANHPVLHCLNPLGEVPPGRTAMVEFVFSPLEAKRYRVDVPIHIHGGDSVLVTFEGQGLNSLPLNPSDSFHFKDAEPSVSFVKRVPIGQVAFLPENTISLGDIPLCYYPSRIVFLTNLSRKDAVVYEWDLSHNNNQQVVQIHPERGRLCPEESVLCVLTFTPSDYPTIYQLDLICQVSQEAALIQYHQALQHWEEETERQPEETFAGGEWEHASVSVKGTLLRKYKALPPICASRRCEAKGTTCSRMRRSGEEAPRRCPVPPKPALLHLGLTARSHELMDYLTYFPYQLNKQHVYRSLQSFNSQMPEIASTGTPRPAGRTLLTHGPVRDILIQVLAPLLRSCLDDPTFGESLISLASEPMYFSQLRGTASAHPSSLPSSLCIPSPAPPCPAPSSAPPTPQHQALLSGTDAGVKEECVTEGSGETGSRNPVCIQHRTQNTEKTQTLRAAHTLSELRAGDPAQTGRLVDMCVHVLLNTLQNLMKEAVQGELDLTVHPRAIILPPASTSRRHKQT